MRVCISLKQAVLFRAARCNEAASCVCVGGLEQLSHFKAES